MSIPLGTLEWLMNHDFFDDRVDLDRVRLRVGGPPTWYLSVVRNRAITLGHQVWFREEQHREDRALIAHDLVHVGQYARMHGCASSRHISGTSRARAFATGRPCHLRLRRMRARMRRTQCSDAVPGRKGGAVAWSWS